MTSKFKISGKVIRGDGYGRKIGFPTMNLDRKQFLKLEAKPKFGIYAGAVTLGVKTPRSRVNSLQGRYRAGIIIGPLDKKKLPKIEAYLIGYKGKAYGARAVFELKKFIRKFKKFKTEKELIIQIGKDLSKC